MINPHTMRRRDRQSNKIQKKEQLCLWQPAAWAFVRPTASTLIDHRPLERCRDSNVFHMSLFSASGTICRRPMRSSASPISIIDSLPSSSTIVTCTTNWISPTARWPASVSFVVRSKDHRSGVPIWLFFELNMSSIMLNSTCRRIQWEQRCRDNRAPLGWLVFSLVSSRSMWSKYNGSAVRCAIYCSIKWPVLPRYVPCAGSLIFNNPIMHWLFSTGSSGIPRPFISLNVICEVRGCIVTLSWATIRPLLLAILLIAHWSRWRSMFATGPLFKSFSIIFHDWNIWVRETLADSFHPLPCGFADVQEDDRIMTDDLPRTFDYPRHIRRLQLR